MVRKIDNNMLKTFCYDSEEESTKLDIQKVCGEDETKSQISFKIANMDFDEEAIIEQRID